MPFNPITLSYAPSAAGQQLEASDSAMRERAAVRATTLDAKSRGARYDIVSGLDGDGTYGPSTAVTRPTAALRSVSHAVSGILGGGSSVLAATAILSLAGGGGGGGSGGAASPGGRSTVVGDYNDGFGRGKGRGGRLADDSGPIAGRPLRRDGGIVLG